MLEELNTARKIVEERIVGTYTLKLMDNGILHAHVSDDQKAGTIPEIKEMVKIMGEMVNYKKVPLLNTRAGFALPSPEVRLFWANLDSCPYTSAEAFVVHSIALRILGNFYLKIEKPSRPSKLFSDQKSAIEWLKTFL